MSLYSRAGEVLQRNWRRFIKSLRIQFGRIRVYSSRLGMTTRAHIVSLEKSYQIYECPLAFEAIVQQPELDSVEILDGLEGLDTPVVELSETAEQNPEIHVFELITTDPVISTLEASLETRAIELNFNSSFEAAVYSGNISFTPSSLRVGRILPPGVATKTHADLDRLFKLPLTRTAIPMNHLSTQQRIDYWKQVLAALERPAADLKLVGIFRNVPKVGVQKAKVDPKNGLLRVWMKPGSSLSPLGGTLLIARDVKENRIFQVFARDEKENR